MKILLWAIIIAMPVGFGLIYNDIVALNDRLNAIGKFQQDTVAPMHQHILDKLTKLSPDQK
jgi:hypothetical protein